MTQERSATVQWGRRAWGVIGVAAVVVLLVYLASHVSLVLTPIVLALFPAALINPLAARLRRTRISNALGALLLLLLLILAFAIPAYLIVPAFAAQAPDLARSITAGLDQLDAAVPWSRLPGDIGGLSDLAQQALAGLSGGGALSEGLGLVRQVGDFATGTLLTLVALFFYLKDGRRIWQGMLDLVPPRYAGDLDTVAQESFWTIGAFLRGQLLVALVDAVFIGVGLWILGVPLVLPLAVLVFFGGLFPIVGAFLSGTVAVVVALADEGPGTALAVLGVVLLVQQLEGHVLAPIIQGRIIALHPLLIILSVTTGGVLMGILGAFLGVPVAAVIARIVDHLRGRAPAAGPAATGTAGAGATEGAGADRRTTGASGAGADRRTTGASGAGAVRDAREDPQPTSGDGSTARG